LITRKSICLIAFLLGVSGCAGYSHILVERVPAAETGYGGLQPSQVNVFTSETDVPKGYLVLAKLKTAEDDRCYTRGQLLQAFREKAAECGANAVILVEIKEVPFTTPDSTLVEAPKYPNDTSPAASPNDYWAPVTASQADIHVSLGPKSRFKGWALAVKVPVQNN
jgi:hypothetical protein